MRTDASGELQPASEHGAASVPTRSDGSRPLWLALALLLLPLAVSAGVLLLRVGAGFYSVSDNAQNELRTRDVGRHFLLLGPYARDGWNHLGPALYYLLAAPYRLTGGNSVGMYVGALTINAAALVGIVLIAWRRGGFPGFLSTVLGLAFFMHALGADFLRDPWNPSVTVLPFGLLLFLVWELAAGAAWALPLAAGVTTFLVQTHVGYLPLALPLLLVGSVLLVVRARRHRDNGAASLGSKRLVRAAMVTGVVLVAAWIPPALGVIRNAPGNAGKAASYFVNPERGAKTHTVVDGYRAVAEQFSASPEFITGPNGSSRFSGEPDYLLHNPVPWLLLPFALAVWWLRRAGVKPAVGLAGIVSFAALLGVLAVARTVGPVYAYRLRWTWLLGILALVVVIWALWLFLSRTSSRGAVQLPVVLVVAGILALTTSNTLSAAREPQPQRPESITLKKLLGPMRSALPARPGVVVIDPGTFVSGAYGMGALLYLEHAGIPARLIDTPLAGQTVGPYRLYHGEAVRAWLSFADDDAYDKLARKPDMQLIVHVGNVAPGQRGALLAEIARLQSQAQAGSLSKQAAGARVDELFRRLPHYVGIFLRTSAP